LARSYRDLGRVSRRYGLALTRFIVDAHCCHHVGDDDHAATALVLPLFLEINA